MSDGAGAGQGLAGAGPGVTERGWEGVTEQRGGEARREGEAPAANGKTTTWPQLRRETKGSLTVG